MAKKKICDITIKGQKYKVFKAPNNKDYYGQTNTEKRTIEITQERIEETIAHELLHSYFFECGLYQYEGDELLHEVFGHNASELLKNYNIILKAYKKDK